MEKLQELGVKKDSVVERDSTFQTNAVRKLEKKQEKQKQERPEEPLVRMTEEQPSEPVPQFELDLLSVGNPISFQTHQHFTDCQ